jgi:tetratricopeptide (TPR) repeat protein
MARSAPGDVRIGVALALAGYSRDHPGRTLRALRRLPQRDPAVAFNRGLVEAWAGQTSAAVGDWRRTRQLDPYGFYGTRADNLLHPDTLQSYPPYIAPPVLRIGPAAARAETRRHPGNALAWLRLAAALEGSDRVAAIRAAQRAVALDPSGVSARVALAVLAFDKDDPAKAVGTVATLAAQQPSNAEVRFHFALLLLWLKRRDDAVAQFQQLLAATPKGPYARDARIFLSKLDTGG